MTHALTLIVVLHRIESFHLILTGMQTEFCIDTTCRGALGSVFEVTLAEGQQ